MGTRVFLTVEGPNDGGAIGRAQSIRDNDPSYEGAFQPLLRHSTNDELEVIGQKVAQLAVQGLSDPAAIIVRRCRQASTLAEFQACDVLVFHQDVDGPADGSADDGAARRKTIVDAIAEGARVAEQNGEGIDASAVIAAVPLRTIEAWLMADPDAVTAVAQDDAYDISAAAAAPENLWGRQAERTSSHPKCVLRRGISASRALRTSQYRRLAETLDPTVVTARCPVSFRPFFANLQTAL